MADARRARTRRRGRVITIGIAIAVVVCLAGGGAAWATLRPHGPSYRLATAEKADVSQTASLAGTVASATRADRAFQVSGTVSAVGVKVGDKVAAGQTLATLDTSVLDDTVTQSQQSVSTAQQKLDDDLASQTASASAVTAGAASGADATSDGLALGTFVAAAAPTGGADLSTLEANVNAAQDQLLTDGNAVTAAQKTLTDDLAQISTTAPSDGSSGTDCYQFLQATVSTTDPGQAQTDIANAKSELSGCQTAVQTVIADEQAVAAAQAKVQEDVSTLNDAVTALENGVTSQTPAPSTSPSSQPGSGSGGGTGAAGGASGSAPQSGSGGGTSRGGSGASKTSGNSGISGAAGASGKTSTPASAEQIAADQASLAAAQANLAVAQQNVGLATLTSPIAGTVAAVGVSAGSSVTARSTSQVISVIGDNGWVVDTAVTATAIGPLKVGQSASVNVSGVSGALAGKVTAIGFLNTATDSSSPSYDVTLALTGSSDGLLNGASARLTVDVDTASNVLTVPSSAVHLGTGNTYSVDVLSDGKESARQVKVGAIGAARTQVTSGLSEGDQVVLADLSSTVSSDSTQSSTNRFTRVGTGTAGLGGATVGGFGGAGAGTRGGGAQFEPKNGG